MRLLLALLLALPLWTPSPGEAACPVVATTINAVADVTTSSTAKKLVAANSSRVCLRLCNTDGTNHVRLGDSNVTTSKGVRLAAMAAASTANCVDLGTADAVWAVAEAGGPVISILEFIR